MRNYALNYFALSKRDKRKLFADAAYIAPIDSCRIFYCIFNSIVTMFVNGFPITLVSFPL